MDPPPQANESVAFARVSGTPRRTAPAASGPAPDRAQRTLPI